MTICAALLNCPIATGLTPDPAKSQRLRASASDRTIPMPRAVPLPRDLDSLAATTLRARLDSSKGPVPTAIRASRAKLTALSLRRLREGLFHLELQLIHDMVTGGINLARVTALSHCAHAIEVVDVLKLTNRER
jgi:hypothetical protein